jgi:hypothetical protein
VPPEQLLRLAQHDRELTAQRRAREAKENRHDRAYVQSLVAREAQYGAIYAARIEAAAAEPDRPA